MRDLANIYKPLKIMGHIAGKTAAKLTFFIICITSKRSSQGSASEGVFGGSNNTVGMAWGGDHVQGFSPGRTDNIGLGWCGMLMPAARSVSEFRSYNKSVS